MANILNYNMTNCVYFKKVTAKSCCGRKKEVSVCAIPDADGTVRHKACYTEMPYCNFQSKTIEPE